MNELIAKTIIKDQVWIVTDGEKKVGNISANSSGYGVKLNGNQLQFKNTADIKKSAKIRFDPIKSNNTKAVMPYPEYPTTPRTYNSMFDVRRGLHLYTKNRKSKCYYAAGYYVLNQNGTNEVVFCPKYIFIQRYPYDGPFKTASEAENLINSR